MVCEFHPVRRLSTVSSVTKPPHYSLTTQWRWYYKGNEGSWVEYGQPVSQPAPSFTECPLAYKHASPSLLPVTSWTLEEAFLSGTTAEVRLVKGHRDYIISFRGTISCCHLCRFHQRATGPSPPHPPPPTHPTPPPHPLSPPHPTSTVQGCIQRR